MHVTIKGKDIGLKRPTLRRAAHLFGVVRGELPEDGDDAAAGPDLGTLTAAVLGVCLPPVVGAPKPPKGFPSRDEWVDYGDAVDRWCVSEAGMDSDAWLAACDTAWSMLMASLPTEDRAEAAAGPTEAHGVASSEE